MNIELLYFEGCPSYAAFLPELRDLLAEAGIAEAVELRRVETVAAAERERFLGSPTLRVNGEDVDPTAGGRRDFGLKCRLYRGPYGYSRTPPESWILTALARAA